MIGSPEAEAQRVVMWWGRDPLDWSWVATDPSGVEYRVSRFYKKDGSALWGYSWRDHPYYRMGSTLFDTSEECRSFIELVLASEDEIAA